jgi:hypothetical protein
MAAANAAYKRGHSDQDWARGITNNSGYWGRQEPDSLFGSASKDPVTGAGSKEGADLDTDYVPHLISEGEVREPSPANAFGTQRVVSGPQSASYETPEEEDGEDQTESSDESYSPRIGLTGESL